MKHGIDHIMYNQLGEREKSGNIVIEMKILRYIKKNKNFSRLPCSDVLAEVDAEEYIQCILCNKVVKSRMTVLDKEIPTEFVRIEGNEKVEKRVQIKVVY